MNGKELEEMNKGRWLTITNHNGDIKPCNEYTHRRIGNMFKWEIRKMYENMIERYQPMIGKHSEFGSKITKKFIDILKKRLAQLKGENNNGLL